VNPEKLVPLIRDLGMFVTGAASFVWTVTHGANVAAMGISALVMTGPAAIAAWASRSAIPDSPSSPPSALPPASPPQPSPSPSGAAEP
jgi:hypothetical protein